MKKYNNTLIHQFWGHTHKDLFMVYKDNVGFGFGNPSLMSDHRYPSFRIYEYEPTTYEVVNYYHYVVNLTNTIIHNKLNVSFSYNVKETYNLDKLDGKNFGMLAESFKKDKKLFDVYCKYYYNTPLNYTCSNELINDIFV